jgi:hypothetical protein
MTRPCVSPDDTGGNPMFKMHACATDMSRSTLCGLPVDPDSVGVVAGYATMCRTCFPPRRETAWTRESDNPGDSIQGEGRGDP